jgi:hypothetical protein
MTYCGTKTLRTHRTNLIDCFHVIFTINWGRCFDGKLPLYNTSIHLHTGPPPCPMDEQEEKKKMKVFPYNFSSLMGGGGGIE